MAKNRLVEALATLSERHSHTQQGVLSTGYLETLMRLHFTYKVQN